MKRIALTLSIATALLVTVFSASAGSPVTLLGSLVSVSNTPVASSAVSIATINVAPKTLYIQNNGIGTTNNLVVYGQLSLDGTNWTTIAQTYQPASTNAMTDTWITTNTAYSLYARVIVTATNQTVGVGVSLQQ